MNTNIKKNTSADDKLIGFDYQFYYFFFLILDLRHGEKIGFEVKDDIHIELPDGKLIYIQSKHSVQKNSDGEIINLTERDKDLWKTLNNWVNDINNVADPMAFLNIVSFELVTNKNNANNPFFIKVGEFVKEQLTVKEFKDYLKNLIRNTSDAAIKGYIKNLHAMRSNLLSYFLKKIRFSLSEDDLIERIKKRLLEKIHLPERIEDVYRALHSSLRDKNYLTIKNGEKIEISFQDFNRDFKHCFKVGLSTKLPIRSFHTILPTNPKNQLFIKQLIDIGALSDTDDDEIIELTTHMLMLYNNLFEWEASGDIGPSERTRFDDNSILIWKNSFNSKYREIKKRIANGEEIKVLEKDIQIAALLCLEEMQRTTLFVEETQLDMRLSNGQFYLLTEGKSIGWHFDWKNRY